MDFLKTLIGPTPPDALMIDVGANEGGYTWSMRQHRPGATILAFEPLQEFCAVTAHRYAEDPLIYVFPYGVSDFSQTETGLHVHEAWTLDRPERAVRGLNATHGAPSRAVHFVTIDGFLDTHTHLYEHVSARRIDFIKIDTDGYEARVLRGARQTLLRDRPTILIELSYMVQDIGDSVGDFLDDIYNTLGYVLVDQGGYVRERDHWDQSTYPWVGSFDVAMIPRERLAEVPFLD